MNPDLVDRAMRLELKARAAERELKERAQVRSSKEQVRSAKEATCDTSQPEIPSAMDDFSRWILSLEEAVDTLLTRLETVSTLRSVNDVPNRDQVFSCLLATGIYDRTSRIVAVVHRLRCAGDNLQL